MSREYQFQLHREHCPFWCPTLPPSEWTLELVGRHKARDGHQKWEDGQSNERKASAECPRVTSRVVQGGTSVGSQQGPARTTRPVIQRNPLHSGCLLWETFSTNLFINCYIGFRRRSQEEDTGQCSDEHLRHWVVHLHNRRDSMLSAVLLCLTHHSSRECSAFVYKIPYSSNHTSNS